MGDNAEPRFEFDVALSFAGEDRLYVSQVADGLRRSGTKVFYDEFEAVALWGEDLYDLFDDVFRKRARFAVLFVSRYYAAKPWPRLERRAAQARALREASPYVLPVRLDDTELPGLAPTLGYVDARTTPPAELVEILLAKLHGTAAGPPAPSSMGVPRTPEQRSELLARRPPAWEYLLFAATLSEGKARLEPKFRDHELGWRRPRGEVVRAEDVAEFIEHAKEEALAAADNLGRVLDPIATTAAFGPPDVPGDPDRIVHLALRLVDLYETFLDWSTRIRSAQPPDRYRSAFLLLARFVDQPVLEARRFIDELVSEMEQVVQRLDEDDDDPIELNFQFTLAIDGKLVDQFNRELKRAQRRWF